MRKALRMLFILTLFAAMCHAAYIEMTLPNGGEKLVLKKTVTVTWVYSGTIDEELVKLVLFKGGTDPAHKVGNIVQNISIRIASFHGAYNWQVGAYEGGFAGTGNDYYMQIVSMNGNFSDFSNNPFSIVFPELSIERGRYVEFNPDPGCPMCGIFEIGALLAQFGNPSGFTGNLVLMRNGRQVGLLGRLGRGGLLPTARVRLKFPADDFAQIGRGGEGFEAAIIGDTGKILQSKSIVLKMKQ